MGEGFDDHSLGSTIFCLLDDIRQYGVEQAKARFLARRSMRSWYQAIKKLKSAGIDLNKPLPPRRVDPLSAPKHYFVIQLILPSNAPASLWTLQQKNELYLSPNVRLCGLDKMAYLESMDLAEEYIGAVTPRISRRYGCNVELKSVRCECRQRDKTDRIAEDSALVRARLQTGILASNQRPGQSNQLM